MKIKVNYPSEQSGIELLNKGIEEFKATLYIESIAKLNVSEETKKEIEQITIYDRKEETKASLQYDKNHSYLNENYNNNAYIIMKFLKDLKIDIYSIDLETLINKGGLK